MSHYIIGRHPNGEHEAFRAGLLPRGVVPAGPETYARLSDARAATPNSGLNLAGVSSNAALTQVRRAITDAPALAQSLNANVNITRKAAYLMILGLLIAQGHQVTRDLRLAAWQCAEPQKWTSGPLPTPSLETFATGEARVRAFLASRTAGPEDDFDDLILQGLHVTLMLSGAARAAGFTGMETAGHLQRAMQEFTQAEPQFLKVFATLGVYAQEQLDATSGT